MPDSTLPITTVPTPDILCALAIEILKGLSVSHFVTTNVSRACSKVRPLYHVNLSETWFKFWPYSAEIGTNSTFLKPSLTNTLDSYCERAANVFCDQSILSILLMATTICLLPDNAMKSSASSLVTTISGLLAATRIRAASLWWILPIISVQLRLGVSVNAKPF